MKLTDEELLTTPAREKIYKLFDGGGLYAEIPPKGNIRWRLKYSFKGKETRMSLGIYPDISIENARLLRDDFRIMIEQGINPAELRRESKLNVRVEKIKISKITYDEKAAYVDRAISVIREALYDLREIMKASPAAKTLA